MASCTIMSFISLFFGIFLTFFMLSSTVSHTSTKCRGTNCIMEGLEYMDVYTDVIQNLTNAVIGALDTEDQVRQQRDQFCTSSTREVEYPNLPRDCTELAAQGQNTSGIYLIHPKVYPADPADAEIKPFYVYCDMTTDGGGWTLFQRRFNGLVDFYTTWEHYKLGFGYVIGEHWVGLKKVHRMMLAADYELRIDLEDYSGNYAYAKYDYFQIGEESASFKLLIGAYEGTAGDSLTYHHDMPFATKDRDHNDCAASYRGCWWYHECYRSNLNGLYRRSGQVDAQSMNWFHWNNRYEALKTSEIKMRRLT